MPKKRAATPVATPAPNARRPEDWSAEERLRVVAEAAKLSESELGSFLRLEGLHEETLREWRAAALDGLTSERARSQHKRSGDQKRAGISHVTTGRTTPLTLTGRGEQFEELEVIILDHPPPNAVPGRVGRTLTATEFVQHDGPFFICGPSPPDERTLDKCKSFVSGASRIHTHPSIPRPRVHARSDDGSRSRLRLKSGHSPRSSRARETPPRIPGGTSSSDGSSASVAHLLRLHHRGVGRDAPQGA